MRAVEMTESVNQRRGQRINHEVERGEALKLKTWI